MLENGHSNMQTKFGVHITSNIFKIIQFKNHGIAPTPPPDLPTLKAYPTPGVGGRFEIFHKNEGKGWTWRYPEQFYPLAVRFWAPGRKLLGGLLQLPLGEHILTLRPSITALRCIFLALISMYLNFSFGFTLVIFMRSHVMP